MINVWYFQIVFCVWTCLFTYTYKDNANIGFMLKTANDRYSLIA